ncbi:hypothetical protein BC828DRAFT_385767 [Blastocladiella britannica]|nr:hypothetical protein BC828DRAFT_385767 [Blastocladiella britannica]
MTLPKTTAAPHAAQKDRHTARNGAERGDKKQGGGAANWGIYSFIFYSFKSG